jgi:hypothetical protein
MLVIYDIYIQDVNVIEIRPAFTVGKLVNKKKMIARKL